MAKAFFCENCGTRVEGDADFCTGCGRTFRAVKCPQCGNQGKMESFQKGCPVCGYLAEKSMDAVKSKASTGFWERMSKPLTITIILLLLLILLILLLYLF